MKAMWQNTVIAEVDKSELIRIEGNWYFPPSSIEESFFSLTDRHTHCPWKGDASYYDITVNEQTYPNGAWFYPAPLEGSAKRVGKDFTNYVAFYNDVEVVD